MATRWQWLSAALLAACSGDIISPPGLAPPVDPGTHPTPVAPPCEDAATGPSPLLRLTPLQLGSALDDVLGTSGPSPWNEPTAQSYFSTALESNLTTEQEVEALLNSVEARVAAATATPAALNALTRCNLSSAACPGQFIAVFGRRAFRRPLHADEAALYTQLLSQARQSGITDARAVAMTVEAMLQSPQFLYRDETFDLVAAGAQTRLGPHGLASRLSFFLWSAVPDAALRTAADDGSLLDPAVLEQHTRRLLDDPRARPVLARFHQEWLQLTRLETAPKSAQLFPGFDALRGSMIEEQARFVARARAENRFTFRELMTARRTEVDAPLARHYGLPPPQSGWASVELPADQRAGLLTLAGQMAAEASATDTSVVVRGHVVRTRVMCQTIAAPPANVTTQGSTSADRLANAQCAGCHTLMDPIGQGLEHYDAVGAWRTTIAGAPVNASGTLVAAGPASGAFNGALELADRLASSPHAQGCYVTQWFRYARGRLETAQDRCALERLQRRFETSGGDINQLLLSFVTSDAFTHQGTVQP